MRILAIAVLAAAFAHGSGPVDATVRCSTKVIGGIPSFGLQAWPQTWSRPFWNPADAYVFAGAPYGRAAWKLFSVHGASPGYQLDHGSCGTTRSRVPLRPGGLPRVGHLALGDYPTILVHCSLPGAVLVHYHVDADGKGLPRAASIALRQERGNRPLAFITWSWTQVTAWATPRCETSEPSQP